jgi:hypothetical protein
MDVAVESNDPRQPLLTFPLHAIVELAAESIPSELRIDDLPQDAPQEYELRICGTQQVPSFEVLKMSSEDAHINISSLKRIENKPAETITWLAKVRVTSKGQQFWTSSLNVRTNDDSRRAFVIPVTVTENIPYTVSPAALIISGTNPSLPKQVRIADKAAHSLKILSIEAPPWAEVKVRAEEGVTNEIVLEVVRRSQPDASASPSIVVHLDGYRFPLQIPMVVLE